MYKFKTSQDGYDKEDVHKFVDKVVVEYEKILKKLKDSTKEVETLNKEIKNLKKVGETSDFFANSKQEKIGINEEDLIIERAKRNASKIINNSLLKAQTIEKEAEELQRKVILYKKKFISLIESQKEELNSFGEWTN